MHLSPSSGINIAHIKIQQDLSVLACNFHNLMQVYAVYIPVIFNKGNDFIINEMHVKM